MTPGAVILARGLGTRMRRDPGVAAAEGSGARVGKAAPSGLTAAQAAVADAGLKAMIPVGRPLID